MQIQFNHLGGGYDFRIFFHHILIFRVLNKHSTPTEGKFKKILNIFLASSFYFLLNLTHIKREREREKKFNFKNKIVDDS
jgi:hypothetical protein